MTVPGVNVIVAATFMAAVGDIRRFGDRRKLTAYLGLDPRSASPAPGPPTTATSPSKARTAPATRSSRRAGRPSASPARSPPSTRASEPARPLDRDRRLGAQARLPVLVPAHPRRGLRVRPALADHQEDAPARAAAPAPRAARAAATSGRPTTRCANAERELALQAQRAYKRTVADWQARPTKVGASATPGRASKSPRRAKPRGRPQAPDVCASLRQSPAPTTDARTGARAVHTT